VLVVVAGRREGRSTAAIKWLMKDEQRVLITLDPKSKQILLDLAIKHSTERPHQVVTYYGRRIVTLQELHGSDALRGMSVSEVGVDDAEVLFAMLLKLPRVTFATIAGTAISPQELQEGIEADERRRIEQTPAYGIRPHRYPRSPEEAEKMRAAADAATPNLGQLEFIRSSQHLDDDEKRRAEAAFRQEVPCKCTGFAHREECPNWVLPL
jgi:hypothetical protein